MFHILMHQQYVIVFIICLPCFMLTNQTKPILWLLCVKQEPEWNVYVTLGLAPFFYFGGYFFIAAFPQTSSPNATEDYLDTIEDMSKVIEEKEIHIFSFGTANSEPCILYTNPFTLKPDFSQGFLLFAYKADFFKIKIILKRKINFDVL